VKPAGKRSLDKPRFSWNPSVEIPLQSIVVRDGFWLRRQQINVESAIPHQWQQLEKTGRLDNFRKAAGSIGGNHQGFFYNDSDVHKWAEAAFTAAVHSCPSHLKPLLDEYIDLAVNAQEEDGYLFTYNQLNFPGQRWLNLQIEHELYTMGHFIEAGVAAHHYAGDPMLFEAVRKCADLIADVFFDAPPLQTPGHQEIEIALLRLFGATGKNRYLEMATRFLERRGRTPVFGFHLLRQFVSHGRRSGRIVARGQDGTKGDPQLGFDMSENLSGREPRFIKLRSNFQFLTGRYHQQHRPIRKMTEPVGHSVRWAYLQTAAAMLYRKTGDASLLSTLETSWNRMVRKKMYLTGGIGSLPVVEGFGRDFELDNEFAYAETCAAIASIFWSWQMTLATGNATYADLTEWQLYNAAAVGIGLDGRSYLYRNPLESAGGLTRKPWFDTACCPGNIARLWAQLGKYVASADSGTLWVHQYIDCEADIQLPGNRGTTHFKQESGLPWSGLVKITVVPDEPDSFSLQLRIPGWAKSWQVRVNNEILTRSGPPATPIPTGGGFSPDKAFYLEIDRFREGETKVELHLDVTVAMHHPHPKVRSNRGRLAISRGPLVYCLESIDNPSVGMADAVLSGRHPIVEKNDEDLPGGVVKLVSQDADGRPLVFIPYYCWANREPSRMQVWVDAVR
jgi:uncharacterized protein